MKSVIESPVVVLVIGKVTESRSTCYRLPVTYHMLKDSWEWDVGATGEACSFEYSSCGLQPVVFLRYGLPALPFLPDLLSKDLKFSRVLLKLAQVNYPCFQNRQIIIKNVES